MKKPSARSKHLGIRNAHPASAGNSANASRQASTFYKKMKIRKRTKYILGIFCYTPVFGLSLFVSLGNLLMHGTFTWLYTFVGLSTGYALVQSIRMIGKVNKEELTELKII